MKCRTFLSLGLLVGYLSGCMDASPILAPASPSGAGPGPISLGSATPVERAAAEAGASQQFDVADKDQDGFLSRSESPEKTTAFDDADLNGDGRLSFSEYMRADEAFFRGLPLTVGSGWIPDDVAGLFQTVDADMDRRVTAAELDIWLQGISTTAKGEFDRLAGSTSGSLNRSGFTSLWAKVVKLPTDSRDLSCQAGWNFALADTNGDGVVTGGELDALLAAHGSHMRQAVTAISQSSPSLAGKLDLVAFSRFWHRASFLTKLS